MTLWRISAHYTQVYAGGCSNRGNCSDSIANNNAMGGTQKGLDKSYSPLWTCSTSSGAANDVHRKPCDANLQCFALFEMLTTQLMLTSWRISSLDDDAEKTVKNSAASVFEILAAKLIAREDSLHPAHNCFLECS